MAGTAINLWGRLRLFPTKTTLGAWVRRVAGDPEAVEAGRVGAGIQEAEDPVAGRKGQGQ